MIKFKFDWKNLAICIAVIILGGLLNNYGEPIIKKGAFEEPLVVSIVFFQYL